MTKAVGKGDCCVLKNEMPSAGGISLFQPEIGETQPERRRQKLYANV